MQILIIDRNMCTNKLKLSNIYPGKFKNLLIWSNFVCIVYEEFRQKMLKAINNTQHSTRN